MRKLPVWLLALALTAVGTAGTLGYGYQKANDEGVNGKVNIIVSQTVIVENIDIGDLGVDNSGIGVIADDGLSYSIGLQLKSGDVVDDIEITLSNDAQNTAVVNLTTVSPDVDIDIWYEEAPGTENENTLGRIDLYSYLIKVKGLSEEVPATQKFIMGVEIGQNVEPGFYVFDIYIIPTNFTTLDTNT